MKTIANVAMAVICSMLMCGTVFASNGVEPVATTEVTYDYLVDQTETVKAKTTDVYDVTLRRGETFYIYVSGDGDTDLDLYIYDENGNLIDSDLEIRDSCLCSVTPKWTGKFKVKIKNLGNVYNRYHFYII